MQGEQRKVTPDEVIAAVWDNWDEEDYGSRKAWEALTKIVNEVFAAREPKKP